MPYKTSILDRVAKLKANISDSVPDFMKDPKIALVTFALAACSICASAQQRVAGELRIRADGTTTYTSYENGNTQTANQGSTITLGQAQRMVSQPQVRVQSSIERHCQQAINDMNNRNLCIDPAIRLPAGAIAIGIDPTISVDNFNAKVYYADGTTKRAISSKINNPHVAAEHGNLDKTHINYNDVSIGREIMGYSPNGFYGQTATGPGVEYSTQTTVTDGIYRAAETVNSLSHLVREASGLAHAVRTITGGNHHGGGPHGGRPMRNGGR